MNRGRLIGHRPSRFVAIALVGLVALAAACGSDAPDPTPEATSGAPATEPTSTSAPLQQNTGQSGSTGDFASSVFTVGEGSVATFTVREQLSSLPAPNDAVLTTEAITGIVLLNGDEFQIEIDLHALESDQSRRDDYVKGTLFPNQPITTVNFSGIDEIPDGLSDGDEISTEATGTVNVNGADAEVTFEIEARLDDDVLFVLGRADFVWADFGMSAPQSRFFDVEDDVRVEVLLSTER